MLDFTRPISLPDYPDLFIYPDLEATDRYYAFAQPRLALVDEHPDITLMTYQKGGAITGGQMSLTTTLELSVAEQQGVVAALRAQGSSPPCLSFPDWIDGQVTAEIDDVLTLTGRPALITHNQCVLSASLSAEQAQALVTLWPADTKWLRLRYTAQFTGWTSDRTTTQKATHQAGYDRFQSFSVHQTNAQNVTQQLANHLAPVDGKRVDIKLDKR